MSWRKAESSFKLRTYSSFNTNISDAYTRSIFLCPSLAAFYFSRMMKNRFSLCAA